MIYLTQVVPLRRCFPARQLTRRSRRDATRRNPRWDAVKISVGEKRSERKLDNPRNLPLRFRFDGEPVTTGDCQPNDNIPRIYPEKGRPLFFFNPPPPSCVHDLYRLGPNLQNISERAPFSSLALFLRRQPVTSRRKNKLSSSVLGDKSPQRCGSTIRYLPR